MSEVEQYIKAELDPSLKVHLEDFNITISNVINEADTALVGLGRRIAPDYPWIPRAKEGDVTLNKTRAALLPFKTRSKNSERTVYAITPGDIGPVPENLIRGETYALKGLATDERICCSPLYGAYFGVMFGDPIEFYEGDERRLEAFDGETFKYNGHFVGGCDDCEDHTAYDSFTLLRADGTEALDEDYVPLTYAAIKGMVTVVGEVPHSAFAA